MFIITTHARERYVERFSAESEQFAHLSSCRQNECETCRDLTFNLNSLVKGKRQMWDKILQAKLKDAEEIKIFQNNAVFMSKMYANYGCDKRYRFLVEGRILFVICVDGGRDVVKTCMDVNYPVNGSMVIANFLKRPKFKKKEQVYE